MKLKSLIFAICAWLTMAGVGNATECLVGTSDCDAGGGGGGATAEVITGNPTYENSFKTNATNLASPEGVDWDKAEQTFVGVTDGNPSRFEEFTRNVGATTSVKTYLAGTLTDWIALDSATRNPDGLEDLQFELEWEIIAVHPGTGDVYIVNTVNSKTDCTGGTGGLDPKDVQHMVRLARDESDVLQYADIWRLPSGNGDGAQCTGGTFQDPYPAFEIQITGLFIDNVGSFWITDSSGIYAMSVPDGGGTATLGALEVDLSTDLNCGATGMMRSNFDQDSSRVYSMCYDAGGGNMDYGVCGGVDPPCRAQAIVYDWSDVNSRNRIGLVDLSGHDDAAGYTDVPNVERPRTIVILENGPDATSTASTLMRAYWFNNDNSTYNAFETDIHIRDMALGPFTEQFRFNAPADADEFMYTVEGSVDIVGVTCRVDMPVSVADDTIQLQVNRMNVEQGADVGVFTPNLLDCNKAGITQGRVAAAGQNQLEHGDKIHLTFSSKTNSPAQVVVVLHLKRVANRP